MNKTKTDIKRAADNLEAMVEAMVMSEGLPDHQARAIIREQMRQEKNYFNDPLNYPLSKKPPHVD